MASDLDMGVEEFIERYCDFEVYPWQRQVIEARLSGRQVVVRGRKGGMASIDRAMARMIDDIMSDL